MRSFSVFLFCYCPEQSVEQQSTNCRDWNAMITCHFNEIYRGELRDFPNCVCKLLYTCAPQIPHLLSCPCTTLKTNKSHTKHLSWLCVRCVTAYRQRVSIINYFVVHFAYPDLGNSCSNLFKTPLSRIALHTNRHVHCSCFVSLGYEWDELPIFATVTKLTLALRQSCYRTRASEVPLKNISQGWYKNRMI